MLAEPQVGPGRIRLVDIARPGPGPVFGQRVNGVAVTVAHWQLEAQAAEGSGSRTESDRRLMHRAL